MKTETNSLIYKTEKTTNKETIIVSIKLNDECKNGHQDFAITASIYEANKPRIDKYFIAGGCCHDEIIKHFPEFKIFVNLHLCDYSGIPMYAVENGFYHLTEGFNNTKIESPKFKNEFCEYYRITPIQFDILNTSKNELQYAVNIQNLGILKQWNKEAKKAIDILQGLTGQTFLMDSEKTQFHAPTSEELQEEAEKQAQGYYTQEAEQTREEAKKNELFNELVADRDKEIRKIKKEFEVKKQVLNIGGEKALDNCIFYNHTNTLAFNWKSYDKISHDLINKITENIQLPKGVTIENK